MQEHAETAKAVTSGVVETGRVFSSGGIDGLILYALLLGTFLIFLALCWALFMLRQQSRECNIQSRSFADAAVKQAEANKDLATAIAATASADMTFKQAMLAHISGLQERLNAYEGKHS